MDHLYYLCLVIVINFMSVHCYIVVIYRERADLLALLCDV